MAPGSIHATPTKRLAVLTAALTLVVAVGQVAPPAHDHAGLVALAAPAEQVAGGFLATFDGSPSAPQPFNPPDWDIQVFNNDLGSERDSVEPHMAQHGPDCSPPMAMHLVDTAADDVFLCKEHLMTSIRSGYGAVYLTPNQMVDFENGPAVISYDLSTFRTSTRDWVDVWVTPFAENMALPLSLQYPALNGPPRSAVHVFLSLGPGGSVYDAEVYRDFEGTALGQDNPTGYEHFLTPDAARRDRVQITLSRTHLRVSMPQYGFTWIDREIPDVGFGRGIVQFGHHGYGQDKGCNTPAPCDNTWHWDNIAISPSVPFTILRADRRWADAQHPDIRFPAPAPDRAFLRFGAVDTTLDVSFDNGATWQPARPQDQRVPPFPVWQSFWHPVPAGTTSVRFRGTDPGPVGWVARDLSLFAAQDTPTPPSVTTTPVATVTPLLSPPPVASTATPTSTPTVAPTSTVTPSTGPSPSPAATVCQVDILVDGVSRRVTVDCALFGVH